MNANLLAAEDGLEYDSFDFVKKEKALQEQNYERYNSYLASFHCGWKCAPLDTAEFDYEIIDRGTYSIFGFVDNSHHFGCIEDTSNRFFIS